MLVVPSEAVSAGLQELLCRVRVVQACPCSICVLNLPFRFTWIEGLEQLRTLANPA